MISVSFHEEMDIYSWRAWTRVLIFFLISTQKNVYWTCVVSGKRFPCMQSLNRRDNLCCEVQIYCLISVWCQDCNLELRCPHQIKFDTIIQSTNTTRVNIKPPLFSRATTTRGTMFITWPISREKLWSCVTCRFDYSFQLHGCKE